MRYVALIPIVASGLVGCGGRDPGPDAAASRPPTAFVVNYPLQYFAQRIAGDAVAVELPVPGGVDPAFWRPGDETLLAYQQADLILLNGATYAKWVDGVTLPPSRLVDTSVAFGDRLIELEGVTHTHGPEGGNAHAGTAFTTWLDPRLAIEHARVIHGAFATRWPAHRDAFDAGLASLEADLQRLDDEIGAMVSGREPTPLLASHPVYQYFARRYGLNVESVHWEPDEPPDETAWIQLADVLADHPARFMLWEDEPLEETTRRLEAVGIAVVVFSPCGNQPTGGDYLTVMQTNTDGLKPIFSR